MKSLLLKKIALFMSSGIDSILIMEYLKEKLFKIKNIFTLSWDSKANNQECQESEEQVAKRYIKLNRLDKKHEFLIPPKSFRKNVDILEYLTIEGISDPAALAMHELSKLTKKSNIKVALCGHGADELFYGYRRHIVFRFLKLFEILPKMPIKKLTQLSKRIKKPSYYLLFSRLIKILSMFGMNRSENLILRK